MRKDRVGAATDSLAGLLEVGAGEAPSIRAPGRPALTYAGLRTHVDAIGRQLAGRGIARADKIAIVLPNGPEMATAFLAVAGAAVAAPLNPAYTANEVEFYLKDLGAKALIVAQSESGAAIAGAERCGVQLLRIRTKEGDAAGLFALAEDGPATALSPQQADQPALVLHTSGTTSRPKIVPLSHGNLAASARHIAATLALGPGDAGLNIMPLFHIHGLIAALLAPLAKGGAIIAAPGFNALKFFSWLEAERPTWYSAVPTMHQAILERAARNAGVASKAKLRFIRSSSASLPPQVFHALEATFGCPIIESYGMTEACHQMTSNPLPPGARKPGSVGLAAGPEVRIADDSGGLLAPGAEGEVVIRGPNVTAGYENNAKANGEAFFAASDGGRSWFRTGDLGRMDGEGYLTISGRIKEIINRGGEKIAPREVDEVLLDHPAVAQAVTFAVPHAKLGEDVAAVVVAREGVSVAEDELRKFASERLAAFKVPRRVLVLAEIPKGATGKVQRIGLAQKLARELGLD